MNDVQQAVEFLERCRQTHVDWIEYYKKFPDKEEQYSSIAGGMTHHERCVAGYDQVLEVLLRVPVLKGS